MIIIYISQRAWRPSNHVQIIINYDAGIVLIDLHQLNVKTTSDNTNQRDAQMQGNLMSTKNRTRRTTTRNIRFPNQMIEQTSLLVKGLKFLSLGNELQVEDNVWKSIHQLKVTEEWTSRVLPSEQDDIVKFT